MEKREKRDGGFGMEMFERRGGDFAMAKTERSLGLSVFVGCELCFVLCMLRVLSYMNVF